LEGLIAVLAIKGAFGTSFGKALVAWILFIVGVGVAILVVSILAEPPNRFHVGPAGGYFREFRETFRSGATFTIHDPFPGK